MPSTYIIHWHRTNPEKVTVAAYPTDTQKPLFIIGKAEGGGLIAIRHLLEDAARKNPTKKQGNTTKIYIDKTDPAAYEMVYRIGLAVAFINKAKTKEEIIKGAKYISNATKEEIWFWASKLLDDEINNKALDALAIISNAKTTNKNQNQHNTQ